MADGRILHRSAGDSAKVSALSDLEYRVWTQYLLSADDHGVMPAEAVKIQADNRALRNRPKRTIQAAIETVISIGLVAVFTHQGQRYIWQPDWKDWQYCRYPRKSVNPPPPHGEIVVDAPQSIGEVTEISPQHARTGGRETQTLTPIPTLTPTPAVNPHGKATNLVNGPDLRRHGVHAWCDFTRGLCLPWGLHNDLKARGGKSDAEMKAWYGSVVAGLNPNVGVGDDLFDFWRNHFAAWVGTVTRKPSQRSATATEGNLRGLAEDLAALSAPALGGPDDPR